MKHAFLILAHHDLEHLCKLINALDSSYSSFYIHWDKKQENKMFASPYYNVIKNKYNVHFVENLNVYWGGVNMVKATILLLKEAFNDPEIGYFHLLSGDDYPIKSFEYIRNFFNDNDHNYLTYIPEECNLNYFFNRYYFYDNKYMDVRGVKNGFKNYIIYYFLLLIQRITWLLVQKLGLHLRKNIGLKYYHGSQWFSFTRDAVSYILQRITVEPGILRRFEHTAVSDESFFIMLMMDSSNLLKTIVNNDLRLRMSNGTLNRGGYVLSEKDFDRIIKSTALFGRKFRTGISNELISHINEKILFI